MKKIMLLLRWMIAFGCVACQPENIKPYNSTDNIYFDFDDNNSHFHERDSIVRTFAYTPDQFSDTILLPVRISGKRVPVERRFTIGIVPSGTTAIQGLHYKPMDNYYVIPADSGSVLVPLIIYNTDTTLQNKGVSILMSFTQTEDFGVAFSKLDTAKIIFSNRLERPSWWDVWEPQFGQYSRVKHQLYLLSVGNIDLYNGDGDFSQIAYDLYIYEKFKRFINDPMAWVESNEAGYVLTKRPDGGYDFYKPTNPSRKIVLKLNVADQRYYFIDENGELVSVN